MPGKWKKTCSNNKLSSRPKLMDLQFPLKNFRAPSFASYAKVGSENVKVGSEKLLSS